MVTFLDVGRCVVVAACVFAAFCHWSAQLGAARRGYRPTRLRMVTDLVYSVALVWIIVLEVVLVTRVLSLGPGVVRGQLVVAFPIVIAVPALWRWQDNRFLDRRLGR